MTKMTFDDLSLILGFRLRCNCETDLKDLQVCVCSDLCYCIDLQNKFIYGVSSYLLDHNTAPLITIFRDLEDLSKHSSNPGVSMLDCADFIHAINSHSSELTKFNLSV